MKQVLTGVKAPCAAIINTMRKNGYMTNKEAVTKLGCASVTRRWTDIKDAGYKIGWHWHEVKTRYSSKPTRIKRYHISGEPKIKIYGETKRKRSWQTRA